MASPFAVSKLTTMPKLEDTPAQRHARHRAAAQAVITYKDQYDYWPPRADHYAGIIWLAIRQNNLDPDIRQLLQRNGFPFS